MSGIWWASLGAALGLGAPFLFRLWQRSAADRADVLPTAAPSPARTRIPAPASARHPPASPPAGLNRKQARRFHGVSVKPGQQACKAAQDLAGQRFLPDEAPAMPLAACDREKCQCGYSHHGDRRDREDRRSGWGTFGGFTPSIPGGNRRARSPDRRSDRKK
jgi:hypothetical protein